MKIGIISFAHMHALSYATHIVNNPEVELAYIWDNDEQRGKEMATKFDCQFTSDFDEFLNTDIDAVIICSENANHKEHVIQAARAKKHILCEKPIATEIEDAKEMIKVCEEEGVILQVAYPVRFAPVLGKAKQLIESGAIGEVIAISGTNHGKMPGGWFIEKDLSGGGAATDHIVHIMDLIRWILKDEVKSVYAELDTRFYDIDVEDCGMVTLELESGVIVSIDPSWSRPQTFPTWGDAIINFVGTKGNLSVDAFKQHTLFYNDGAGSIEQLPFSEDMDEGLIKDFIKCVKKGGNPSITGTDGLRTLEVVKAAHESDEKRETVFLNR
ncbi:Gfo/Idh/MocA family protein [Lederbergia citrea]|uniref:Gfo/Idh/MocA family oxidoreductase n=1 Tax=Lederbergia citrea TaxID=2833581 RepID=A0A942UND0_9BACI|nr:Gfo/Idh/MocA family oxidoreductase [Lederbergia citrea]MBS4206021.1 Gfo/Idh/MocA family oxidoreductase [Lederbergia citrea]MBS4224530.1 Gfo/Idh/MocA family oxidoreductase [Lederbergia citrea]